MDDRALRATVGLSASEFNQLAQGFGPEIEKNILIIDINRWIGYLSPPEEGKKHDCGMFKGLFPPEIFPKGITLWLEHAIGGIKRMRITTDKFRNKSIYYYYNYNCRCCSNKIIMRDI
ncbi:hypothetical protein C5S53_17700 [Methanophagales archaeon]|nr:hypothetical protein C5S53_17700 [Methanophagales archaeon]